MSGTKTSPRAHRTKHFLPMAEGMRELNTYRLSLYVKNISGDDFRQGQGMAGPKYTVIRTAVPVSNQTR